MQLHSTYVSHSLPDYLISVAGSVRGAGAAQFRHVCNAVNRFVTERIKEEHADSDLGASLHRNALMGQPDAVRYFKSMIKEYIDDYVPESSDFPGCYNSLVEAVYHEVWGYSVLAPWFEDKESQALKITNDKVFFIVNGRMRQHPYELTKERRDQLFNTLTLHTPSKPRTEPYIEMNLITGERIMIFNDSVAKGDRSFVLRKYTLKKHTWDEMAHRETIDPDSVKLMTALCQVGYNVMFTGPVRSGKTSMLITWQSYEDTTLEGVSVEATDEIRFKEIMPNSPIVSLAIEEEGLDDVIRPILRSDADYIIMAEARTGKEFDLMLRLANKGTNRCKTTMHSTHVKQLVFDIADEILKVRPNANYESLLFKVAAAYHYVIQLSSDYQDKSKKRILGIYEIHADQEKKTIALYPLCQYDAKAGGWNWFYHISAEKEEIALQESYAHFQQFNDELRKLASKTGHLMESPEIIVHRGA